jgi:hypothetical protein
MTTIQARLTHMYDVRTVAAMLTVETGLPWKHITRSVWTLVECECPDDRIYDINRKLTTLKNSNIVSSVEYK